MSETPRIVQVAEQPAAVIHLTVPRSEIQRVMGPAIAEVVAVMKAQGIAPVGPCFSHHFKRPTDIFDFEVGFPVAQPVVPSGRVRPGALPGARVARLDYRGGYEGLGAAWGGLFAWIESSGLVAQGALWECYAAGPESGADPAAWHTELNCPLAP